MQVVEGYQFTTTVTRSNVSLSMFKPLLECQPVVFSPEEIPRDPAKTLRSIRVYASRNGCSVLAAEYLGPDGKPCVAESAVSLAVQLRRMSTPEIEANRERVASRKPRKPRGLPAPAPQTEPAPPPEPDISPSGGRRRRK